MNQDYYKLIKRVSSDYKSNRGEISNRDLDERAGNEISKIDGKLYLKGKGDRDMKC